MLTALFSTIYVVYGYVSSVTVGAVTHGVDTFFIRSALFVMIAAITLKFGCSTLMGAISGTVFVFVIPTPFSFYLFPAVFSYGSTYDLYMHLLGFSTHASATRHVVIGTAVSSVAMSVVALSILTWVGFLPIQALAFIWFLGIFRDLAVGLAGSLLGLKIVKYTMHSKV